MVGTGLFKCVSFPSNVYYTFSLRSLLYAIQPEKYLARYSVQSNFQPEDEDVGGKYILTRFNQVSVLSGNQIPRFRELVLLVLLPHPWPRSEPRTG